MSCWCRTTVLRIPAVCLGFVFWKDWEDFLEAHREDFCWAPGCFAPAVCMGYDPEAYGKWLPEGRSEEPRDRLDMNLYPAVVPSVPGPFLDYCLEEIAPLPPEESTYHREDCARPLSGAEKRRYLPAFRRLFPGFTLARMQDVHYCRYEWYDGSDAPYLY